MMNRQQETEIALQAAHGDRAALAELCEYEIPMLHIQLLKQFPDMADDLNDMEQIVWEELVRSIVKFRGKSSFRTWFYRLAHNQVRKFFRERYRWRRDWSPNINYRIEPTYNIKKELLNIELLDVLDRLPEPKRGIVKAKILGYTFREIGEIMGQKLEMVRSNYRRATEELEERYHATQG